MRRDVSIVSKRLIAVSSVIGGLLGLLGAAPASAQKDRTEILQVEFSLPDDNGYEIDFDATGPGRGSAGFSADRSGRRSGAGVAYFGITGSGGTVSSRRVRVRLDPVGMVSVRFDERSSRQIEVPGCEGRVTRSTGVFTGKFAFEGENGFAKSTGRRARGTVTTGTVRDCGLPFSAKRKARAAVLASCQPDNGGIYAVFGGPGQPSFHTTNLFDSLGKLAVFRNAYVASRGDFELSRDLAMASTAPPAPFEGSADYAKRRLTGDLAVNLPGLTDPVPLAPAKAKLKRGNSIGIGCDGVGAGIVGVGGRALTGLDPATRADRRLRPGHGNLTQHLVDRLEHVGRQLHP